MDSRPGAAGIPRCRNETAPGRHPGLPGASLNAGRSLLRHLHHELRPGFETKGEGPRLRVPGFLYRLPTPDPGHLGTLTAADDGEPGSPVGEPVVAREGPAGQAAGTPFPRPQGEAGEPALHGRVGCGPDAVVLIEQARVLACGPV